MFMRKAFLTLSIISCLLVITSIFSIKVHAQYLEPEIYRTTINIFENSSANTLVEFQLRNSTQDKFLSAYEFSLPIKNPQNIAITLDDNPISFTTDNANGYTDIKADLGSGSIPPGATKMLKINFTVNKILSERSQVKQLYVPRLFSEAQLSNTKYIVNFPSSFGNPIFVDLSNANTTDMGNGQKRFETNTTNGLLVVWGSQYFFDVESNFTIKNDSDSLKSTLFNIIPKLPTQDVSYSSIVGGDYGLYDSFGNDFAYTQLDPHQSKDISFKARVYLKETDPVLRYPDKYSLEFNKYSSLAKKLGEKITDQMDDFVKLKTLNDLMSMTLRPSKNERINLELLKDIWTRADSTSNLNSFEYCSIIISYAENLGLRGKMDYGYILVPENINLDISLPHVWCDVSINDKSVMFDPLLEALTGVQYFDRQPNDRIQFGTWHPSQQYNNALGLLGNSEGLVKLNFTDITDLEEKPKASDLTISFDLPAKSFSGEFFDGFINIKNDSSKVLRITDIELNMETELSKLIYNQNLTKSVLPKTTNKISLNNLREPNFLYDGEKVYKASLNFDDVDIYELETEAKMSLGPDTRVLLGVLFVVIASMGLSILMILRLKRRDKFITYH
ncbi:MAG: hypothetical protein ABI721_05430 [Candidatus Dojkabacteria bacterium]